MPDSSPHCNKTELAAILFFCNWLLGCWMELPFRVFNGSTVQRFNDSTVQRFSIAISCGSSTVRPCRFTSFIAKNAGRIARYWLPPAIGRERNVRNADQSSWKRSFPYLPLPPQVRLRPPAVPIRVELAPCATSTKFHPDIELLSPLSESCACPTFPLYAPLW